MLTLECKDTRLYWILSWILSHVSDESGDLLPGGPGFSCCCHHGRAIARVHPVHLMNAEWCQATTNPKTKPDDLGCKSSCAGCQSLHPLSPFIIITHPESRYSFYRPTWCQWQWQCHWRAGALRQPPASQVADRGTPSRMDKRVAPDKEGASKQCLRRRKTLDSKPGQVELA